MQQTTSVKPPQSLFDQVVGFLVRLLVGLVIGVTSGLLVIRVLFDLIHLFFSEDALLHQVFGADANIIIQNIGLLDTHDLGFLIFERGGIPVISTSFGTISDIIMIASVLIGLAIAFIYGPERVFGFFIDKLDSFFASLQQRIGIKGMAYVFILPNLLIFTIFILFPMVTNFLYTFTGGDNLFLDDRPFVGTDNLQKLFDCEDFFQPNTCDEDLFARSVSNTAVFVVTQVGLMILVSLLTAILLNRNIRGRGFFRSVFFYPVLLSPIVVGLMWRWILQENGLLNSFIIALGGEKVGFLSSAEWARLWVVIISVWSLMGFYTLILLAGLQAIPLSLYEAASIDGANNWRKFWNITLPLLMPTMLVVVVLSVIRAVQVFDVVFAFTGGGPGSATTYIVQYIYTNGFASPSKEFGLASAASLVMASVLVLFTLVQLRIRGADNVA